MPNNQDIMLDSDKNLSQYEAHIRLMYKYAVVALAGNVKLKDFMEARRHNDANAIDSQEMLFSALVRPNREIGDKIPVGGFGCILMALAIDFAKNYEVIDHINESNKESKMGFRATLFRDIRENKYILGIAGTDAPNFNPFRIDWKDIGTDVSLTLRKLPKKQYDSMINFYFTLKQSGKITDTTPIVVVGHSLGGYLAQLFTLTYPHITQGLYTYQAPGAKRLWRGMFSFLQSLNIQPIKTQTDMQTHRKQAYNKNLSRANRQEAMDVLKNKAFHIHTDKDSNLNNNQWIFANVIQELGTKIPGYLYYINDKRNNHHSPAYCVLALERLNRLLDKIHKDAKTKMSLQDLNDFLNNLYHYSLLHRRGETLIEAIDCVLDDVAYYQNLIESKDVDFFCKIRAWRLL